MSLTGQSPGQRPTIDLSGSGLSGGTLGQFLDSSTHHSTVSNLDLVSTSANFPLVTESAASVTHVIIDYDSSQSGHAGIELGAGSTLKDSVVETSGNPGVLVANAAATPSPSEFVNDTIYATGSGAIGVNAQSSCVGTNMQFTAEATLVNVITHGDLDGIATSATGTCTAPQSIVNVSYSNYDGAQNGNGNVNNDGHNQIGLGSTNPATLFVAPPTDLHERAGTPTIDAGTATGIEATDLDGNPRDQGSAPDMGAYEASPASTAAPPAPTAVKQCVVPRLKGKSLRAARKLLSAAHCALGKVKKPKHHHGHLAVATQSVGAGAHLAAGSSIPLRLAPKRQRHRR